MGAGWALLEVVVVRVAMVDVEVQSERRMAHQSTMLSSHVVSCVVKR